MTSTVNSSGMLIYLIADLSCIFLLVPVMQNLRTSVGSESEISNFKSMLWSFFIYVICDLFMIFFIDENSPFPIWVCNLVTILDEVSLAFVAYFWVLFGTTRLAFKYEDTTWFKILVALPVTLILIISMSSPFTGLFFKITENGTYVRGPWFMVQALTVISYNISVPILSFFTILNTKSAIEKNKAKSLIKFVVAPLSTGVVQLINPNTPIMCLGLVLGIYFVYVDFLNLQIYNDPMTGLNNRRRAEYFLTDCINATTPERPFYLFMIDVDLFKGINDKFGHVEGDRALRIVAEALKKTADLDHGFAARMGGDEFLISTFNNAVQDPDKVKKDLNSILSQMCENNNLPYTLTLSVGYAKCSSSSVKLISLLNEADEMLYQEKEQNHKALNNKDARNTRS